MRKLALVAVFLLASPCVKAENHGNILVHVHKLNNNKGVVRAVLFNSSESYKSDKNTASGAYRKEIGKIADYQSDVEFKDLPYGKYAIKLYHDEDNIDRFKKNFMRVPCVQFGFSNNAKAVFGPPSFNKAKFNLNAAELKMDLKMDQR